MVQLKFNLPAFFTREDTARIINELSVDNPIDKPKIYSYPTQEGITQVCICCIDITTIQAFNVGILVGGIVKGIIDHRMYCPTEDEWNNRNNEVRNTQEKDYLER